MATEQQIEANRLNAQKSTGPKTPEGRAKSALNAIKHGLCAQTVIISSENSDEFRTFSKNLTADFGPSNQLEKNMVKRIVCLSWRLERATKYESLVLDKILKAQFEADMECHPEGDDSDSSKNETNPKNVDQASPLDNEKNETNPSLSKEQLEFLQQDLLAAAIYNDFRDECLLERVRRYESQLARELKSAMDIFYTAQSIRIQKRQEQQESQKKLHEALTQQNEINEYREKIRNHDERFKTMSYRKILDYPGLEDMDEVKILSVIDYEAFLKKVNTGLDPVHIAKEAIQRYDANPHFYTPKRYIETEERLYKRFHNASRKRY